jgi:hypothetical protein
MERWERKTPIAGVGGDWGGEEERVERGRKKRV